MRVGGWCRGSLEDASPSDDVIPPLAQIHLLGRGTGPLNFRSGSLDCGDALSAVVGRLLCKSHLRLLPLHTATVVRCVVSAAAIALRLFPRGRAFTGVVGAPTSDAPGYVSGVTPRVVEVLAALALQRDLWSHILLRRHSQPAEFCEPSHF